MSAPNQPAPEEFDFTMQPGPAGQLLRSRARRVSGGVLTAWILGGVLTAGSIVATIAGVTTACEPANLTCSINKAMTVSMAGFGLFAGLLFIVLGAWSRQRSQLRSRDSEQDLAALPKLPDHRIG